MSRLHRSSAFRAAIANLEVEVKAVGVPFMDPKLMVYQVQYVYALCALLRVRVRAVL